MGKQHGVRVALVIGVGYTIATIELPVGSISVRSGLCFWPSNLEHKVLFTYNRGIITRYGAVSLAARGQR